MNLSENRFYRHPAMPSREFLVTQAVLNAAAECFPLAAKEGVLGAVLSGAGYLRQSGYWPAESMLFRAVPAHFRALVAQYGGTTCR